MEPAVILGAILLLVILYGVFFLLFPKSNPAAQFNLNSSYVISGTDIVEPDKQRVADYTHSFFLFLVDYPGAPSTGDFILIERETEQGGEPFSVKIGRSGDKLMVYSPGPTQTNGLEYIGLEYQKHLFVTVVVKEFTMDLYIDGSLVKSALFSEPNSASYYNNPITISPSGVNQFKGDSDENVGFIHTYNYHHKALSPDEISALYNSYIIQYNKNSTTDYGLKLSLKRNSDTVTELSRKFVF